MQSETPSDVPRKSPGESTEPPIDNSSSTQKNPSVSSQKPDSYPQKRVWVPDDTGKYVKKSSVPPISAVDHNLLLQNSAEYDPYKQRAPEAPISNCFALVHIVKGSVGYGIWSMPNAFRSSGLLIGTVFLVTGAVLISYCFNLLMKIEYRLCKRKRVPYMSYGEAMHYAMEEGPDWMIRLSRESKTITNAMIVIYQYCACVILMSWTAQLVKTVADFYECDVVSLRVLISSLVILYLLLACVPTLSTYSYFSSLAFTLVVVCLVMITVHNFQQERAPGLRTLIGHPRGLNKFIEIALVAMQSVGVTCSTERSMRTPGDFRGVFGVFNLALSIIVLLYMFMGTTGYWIYGEETKGAIMAHLSMSNTWVQAVTLMQAIVVYLSFGLNFFPLLDIVWNEYLFSFYENDSVKKGLIYNYALRLILVVIFFVTVLAVGDYVGFILVLITIANVGILVFVFPATMHICTLWPDDFGRYNWIYYRDLAMVALGVLAMASGVYNVVDAWLQNGPGWTSTTSCLTTPPANETGSR